MNRRPIHVVVVRALLAAAVSLLAFDEPAVADPYEDAVTARYQGDSIAALRILRPLADRGDPRAQTLVGKIYESGGKALPQDYAEAEIWFRQAADQGYAAAQSELGFMFALGRGVSRNDAAAVKWWQLAAEQGDIAAQFSLAGMYWRGDGVPKDYSEALKWYRRAAEQGDAGARYAMGSMYASGEGVDRDYVQAYVWLTLAAVPPALRDRNELARKMTAKEIAQAEVMLSRVGRSNGRPTAAQ